MPRSRDTSAGEPMATSVRSGAEKHISADDDNGDTGRADKWGGAISGFLLFLFTAWVLYWNFHELGRPVPLGSLCLGVVFGWILRYFLTRLQSYKMTAFALVVSTLIGTTVLALFKPFGDKPVSDEFFYYPIGLAIGFFAAAVWNIFVPPAKPRS
jgi:hypothetical protein